MKNEFTRTKGNTFIVFDLVADGDDGIAKIQSQYFYSDYTSTKTHKIKLDEIFGFDLHWRGDGWHIVVKTKEKTGEYDYRSYELSHFVYERMIAQMIADDRISIKSIVNYHNSDNFLEAVEQVMSWAKKIKSE